MTTTRTFALGDILSASTGYLVSPRGVEALYDVLGFMTGDTLWTHQLPRAADECKPHILAQHPDLAGVEVPAEFDGKAHVWRWLAEQVDRFGPERVLSPIPADDHTVIHPVDELRMMKPDAQIITVNVDEP